MHESQVVQGPGPAQLVTEIAKEVRCLLQAGRCVKVVVGLPEHQAQVVEGGRLAEPVTERGEVKHLLVAGRGDWMVRG